MTSGTHTEKQTDGRLTAAEFNLLHAKLTAKRTLFGAAWAQPRPATA